MKLKKCKIASVYLILIILSIRIGLSQAAVIITKDSAGIQQKDIVDVFHGLFSKQLHEEDTPIVGNGPYFSIIPVIGYSMHTGLTGVIATSTSFYSDNQRNKVSRVLFNGNYSLYHQYWFTAISNLFFEKQRLHLVGDTRYYKFPTRTYGLGPDSPLSNPLHIDYSYLRFYQVAFREIASNLFVGLGYNLDYHWNIEVDSVQGIELNQFIKYQKGTRSISSGFSLNIQYDNRRNAVNPRNGTYANVQFRPNMTILGSDYNWQSLLIDIRHYFRFPASSGNILAFWSYNQITISGKPPYLDMPSIGWDNYSNTGRGYVPGRYTGRDLIYLESEYRFSITKNGLLGGVIFVNAENVSNIIPDNKHPVIPGEGLGLRIKINKDSDTNLGVDWGFGTRGSHGIYFNIGEVF
jgi:outer membrane protein assembly factor BamA